MFCIHKITQTIAENKEMWVETKIVDGIFVDYVVFIYICTHKTIQGISVLPATYIKTIKVSLNYKTNVIMKKSLLIAAMFGMSVAASAQQTFTHITIKSGFNQDVICEDKDRITETTTQSDAPDLQGIDGSGFAFFTTGVQTKGAMCGDDGLFKSSHTGATFKVMPTQLNALVLKGTKKTTVAGNSVIIPGSAVKGELVFETPVKAKSIYVVGTSADGDSQIKVTINYTDNTTADGSITMYDWGSSSSDANKAAVVTNLGRIATKKNWAGDAGNIDAYSFKLYESAVNTDNTKTIKSVTVEQTSDDRSVAIFAVSTSNDIVADGIDEVEGQSAVAAYYTLDGVRVAEPVQGVTIVKYTNGVTRKIVKK